MTVSLKKCSVGAFLLAVVYQAAAQAAYAPAVNYTVGTNPCSPVVVDVNGDGKVDIVNANYGERTLSVLTNTGNGKFVLASSLTVEMNPWAVNAGDFNGDGNLDLVSMNSGGGNFFVFLAMATEVIPLLPTT